MSHQNKNPTAVWPENHFLPQPPAVERVPSTSVYIMLRPLTTFGYLLGLLPLQDIWNRRGPTGFRWKSFPAIYSIVVHILFIFGLCYEFGVTLTSMKNGDASENDSALVTVLMVLASASTLGNIIFVHGYAQKYAQIYAQLRQLESQTTFNGSSERKDALTFKEKLLAPLFIVYLLLSIVLSAAVYIHIVPPGLLRVIHTFNCVFISTSQMFPFLHATLLCEAGSSVYRRLNKRIKELLGSAGLGDGAESSKGVPQIKVATQGERTLSEIEHCRYVQHLLSSFSNKISETFTPAFLITTPTFFLFTCYNLYQSWHMVSDGESLSDIVLNLGFALNYLVCLGIISWAVDRLREQHEETADEVHGCRTAVLGDDTVNALHHFSLQLIHSSPQLPVAGFFAVNRSFLLAMIGNLATYLVILVQFRNN